jgi:hypothetical protein
LANCVAIETLWDDGPCEADPACPPESCPPATLDDVYDPEPCVAPDSGASCTPLKRDLGVITTASGMVRRQCLIRQARRPWDGSRCGTPTEAGWTFTPGAWSDGPRPCPLHPFARGPGESLVGVGSMVELHCVEVR